MKYHALLLLLLIGCKSEPYEAIVLNKYIVPERTDWVPITVVSGNISITSYNPVFHDKEYILTVRSLKDKEESDHSTNSHSFYLAKVGDTVICN